LSAKDFMHAKAHGIDTSNAPPKDDSEMYNAGLYEGDIVDPNFASSKVIGEMFAHRNDSALLRGSSLMNAIRDRAKKWPNHRVPYVISSTYTERGVLLTCIRREQIAGAVAMINQLNCVKFVDKTEDDKDYVHIKPHIGCFSPIGRIGKELNHSFIPYRVVGYGCVHSGLIVHELLHALGFFHEQNRADRDDYITIHFENVQAGTERRFAHYCLLRENFEKRSVTEIDHLGTSYDYGSIMHYPATAFSKNREPTMVPKTTGVEIGQYEKLSEADIQRVLRFYDCTDTVPEPTPPQPTECLDEANNCNEAGMCDREDNRSICKKTCGVCPG
uniref:Metalloendopeptidase n=1 Tax=Anisakis simplex TaxID=6269 RepID=A0A0M3JXU2_ANISI